jgi:hypothetical protein
MRSRAKNRNGRFTILSLLLSILTVFSINAQKTYDRTDVRALFPVNVKDLWINNLSGTLDGKHMVDMIIGTDGHTCKGLYTLRNSGTTFFFEGDDHNHELKLVEMTPDFRASGFIYGQYDGEDFSGIWTNADKSMHLPMNLSFVDGFDINQKYHCHLHQWQRIYSGKIENKSINMHVSRLDDQFLIQVKMDSLQAKDIFPAQDNRVEVLVLKSQLGAINNKSLVIDTADLSKVSLVSLDETGYEVSSILRAEAYLDFECYEYADYHSRFLVQKPILGNKKFDVWMEKNIKDYMDECLATFRAFKPENIGTRERWIQYAEGWVEVDLFQKDIISGTLYLHSSLQSKTKKIPFIYDIRSGKEINLQDLFMKEFNANDYFKNVIVAKKKEIAWSKEIKEWVKDQTFNNVTLKTEGISFKTEFNSIFGEQEIVIPFNSVEQNLKNKYFITGTSIN